MPLPAISLRTFGCMAGLTPLLTMHLCYVIAATQGYVDWCLPYWLDCVSVSKSGRDGLAYFVFKGGIIPACILLGCFWHLCRYWLHCLGAGGGRSLPWLGWGASLALLVYTLVLGHSGDTFYLLRRFGVVLYMGLTFIALIRTSAELMRIVQLTQTGRRQLDFAKLILGIAIGSLLLQAVLGNGYDRMENAFEWLLLTLLNVYLLWLVQCWRRTGYGLVPMVGGGR